MKSLAPRRLFVECPDRKFFGIIKIRRFSKAFKEIKKQIGLENDQNIIIQCISSSFKQIIKDKNDFKVIQRKIKLKNAKFRVEMENMEVMDNGEDAVTEERDRTKLIKDQHNSKTGQNKTKQKGNDEIIHAGTQTTQNTTEIETQYNTNTEQTCAEAEHPQTHSDTEDYQDPTVSHNLLNLDAETQTFTKPRNAVHQCKRSLFKLCDGCSKDINEGNLFHCVQCQNYNLCDFCFQCNKHAAHNMLVIRRRLSTECDTDLLGHDDSIQCPTYEEASIKTIYDEMTYRSHIPNNVQYNQFREVYIEWGKDIGKTIEAVKKMSDCSE